MSIVISVNPITNNKKMMGLCGVWYQGTHTYRYLPGDEMRNDSDSSDDDCSYTSIHTGYTYTGRKPEKTSEGGDRGSKEVTWLMSVPVVF